jgi:hypothetical protein
MRLFWIGVFCGGLLAGCTAENTSRPAENIPAAVTAAFSAEHPYATIDHPKELDMQDGSTRYEVPYQRPDGTKGEATYAPSGELIRDKY